MVRNMHTFTSLRQKLCLWLKITAGDGQKRAWDRVLLRISGTTITGLMAVGSEEEQELRLACDGQDRKICRKPQRDALLNLCCCFNGN